MRTGTNLGERRAGGTRRDAGAKSRPGRTPTPPGENTTPADSEHDVGAAIAADGGYTG